MTPVYDVAPVDSGTPTEARPGRVRLALRWAFLVIAVGLLVWAIVAYRDAIATAWHDLGPIAVLSSGLSATLALGLNALSWRAVMRALGLDATRRAAARVFFVSQAGKYLPGAVWPVVAQAEFAKDHGMDRVRATVGSITAMVVGMITAGVVGGVGTTLFVPGALAHYWWVLPLAAVLTSLLVPSVLRRVVGLALRLARRPGEPPTIRAGALFASAGWSVLMWLALGLHAWILLRAIAPGPDVTWPLATGVFALAWLVGFVVVFAPAGAGAREAALIVTLGSVATGPQSVAFALASRILMTLADAVVLVVGLVLGPSRRHRRGRTGAP